MRLNVHSVFIFIILSTAAITAIRPVAHIRWSFSLNRDSSDEFSRRQSLPSIRSRNLSQPVEFSVGGFTCHKDSSPPAGPLIRPAASEPQSSRPPIPIRSKWMGAARGLVLNASAGRQPRWTCRRRESLRDRAAAPGEHDGSETAPSASDLEMCVRLSSNFVRIGWG